VTGQAIGLFERLVLVRFLEGRVFYVMAIHTKRGRRLGQMEVELGLADLAGFVGDVAGVAAHIERGMTAAFLRHIRTRVVTTEAEILFLVPRGRL